MSVVGSVPAVAIALTGVIGTTYNSKNQMVPRIQLDSSVAKGEDSNPSEPGSGWPTQSGMRNRKAGDGDCNQHPGELNLQRTLDWWCMRD